MKTWMCLAAFLAYSAPASPTVVPEIIPEAFYDRNISQYTIRYLSERGSDTASCLSNQTYPVDPQQENTTQHCGSLIYALSGGTNYRSDSVRNMIVLILPGIYSMGERGIGIFNYRNIVLSKLPDSSGEVIIRCDRYLEDNFNNFYVVNAINFALDGLVFTGCGSYSTPIRLEDSLNAVISNCTFRNNTNCGFTASQSEQLLFINCLFHDNNSSAFYNYTDALDPGGFRFSGGLLISWRVTDLPNAQNSVIIKNCTFFRNHAVSNVRNSNDTRPDFYRPRGHGGAIVVTFERVSNFTATIMDTKIIGNTANSSGAGIFISFYGNSINNKVVIKNTTFEANMCDRDGGAISVNTFQVANDNALIVEDSNFDRNKAVVGGGACSVNIQDNLVPEEAELVNNTASFTRCTFTENSSPTGGSAISLVSNSRIDQTLATTNFTDCTFFGNKAEREGAVMSFRFPISLSGTNVFRKNKGGGVSLMQSRVDVGGAVHFIENSAVIGGGMALEDQCLIHLLRDSEMNFIGNLAEMRGGAISVRAPSIAIDSNILPIFNTRCFIEYEITTESFSLDPALWEVRIRFINNTAGADGAAIQATSIDRCTYTPSYNASENATEFEKSIFQLSPQFTFRGLPVVMHVFTFFFSGNRVLNQTANFKRENEIVATAPSKLMVNPTNASGMPGETLSFMVTAFDQAGNRQPAVWSITENNENQSERQVDEFLSLPVSGTEQDHFIEAVEESFPENCSDGLTRHLDFSLVQVIAGGVSSVSSATVNVTCCHPGYAFNKDGGLCQIDETYSIIDRPHPAGRYFYADSDLYVESRNGKLVSAVIPPTFQSCSREGIRPGCLIKFDLPYEQCSQNRTGFLCGRCPEGKGVDLTLRQCKECTVGDAIGVAIVYVAFFVASLLVLFFNIGIPNELKGCLFFIQVVGFVYESSDGINWDFHLSRFFGFNLYLPLCPYPGYNALGTVGYGVLLSLLSIATLVLYIISARFSKVLSNRNSVEGIWLLSIITYKYTADTCFNLLRCQKVSTGENSNEFVYYYNGSIQCFRSVHLAVSIVALFLGVTVVLLFPVIILVISYKTFKLTKPFTDVLIKDIKLSCRWWNGFDLIRRLLFITVVFFFNYVHPSYTQIALFFMGILIYIIFAIFKPYQTRVANLIEALVLIDLLLLTSLFLNTSEQAQAAVRPLSQLLLLLPFISVTIYIAVRLISLIWMKIAPDSFKVFCKGMLNRCSEVTLLLKSLLPQQESAKTEENQIFETENEELRNEEDERERTSDYTAYREELLEL